MEMTLTVIGGAEDAPASEFKIKLPAVIGRGRSANVILKHSLVSRRHCELLDDAGRVIVRDLNSLNGTFVGNQRVQEGTDADLPSGSLLTIGSVTFRAAYGEEDTSDFPPGYAESSRGSKDTVSAIPAATHRAGFKPAKLDALLQDAPHQDSPPHDSKPVETPEEEVEELPSFIPAAEEPAVEEAPAQRKPTTAPTVRIPAKSAQHPAVKASPAELSTEEIPAAHAAADEIAVAQSADYQPADAQPIAELNGQAASAPVSRQDQQTDPVAADSQDSDSHSPATISNEALAQFLPATGDAVADDAVASDAAGEHPLEELEEVADAELIDDDLVELELIEDDEPAPAAVPLPPVVRPGVPPQARRPG